MHSEWFFKCSFREALFTKWHLHCLGVNWYFFWGCDLLSQSLAPKLDLQYSGKIQWFPRFIGTISSPEDKKGVWNIPRGFFWSHSNNHCFFLMVKHSLDPFLWPISWISSALKIISESNNGSNLKCVKHFMIYQVNLFFNLAVFIREEKYTYRAHTS